MTTVFQSESAGASAETCANHNHYVHNRLSAMDRAQALGVGIGCLRTIYLLAGHVTAHVVPMMYSPRYLHGLHRFREFNTYQLGDVVRSGVIQPCYVTRSN